jgi:hypothetical protein
LRIAWVLPDIRVECFVAILNDRVIVAWRKGLFRKQTVARVIPKHTIKQASWAVVNRPGATRGAALLTIIDDETIEIALPKDKPAVANAILLAVKQDEPSGRKVGLASSGGHASHATTRIYSQPTGGQFSARIKP